jgi:crossover junction endodeoxyribonuclease RusA
MVGGSMTTLTLPWPPSVNAYYRSPNKGPLAGRTLISEAGRAYRTAVHEIVSEGRLAASYAGPVAVEIEAHMPDKRRRDLDNLLKGLLDSLTHAGVWLDDSQVVDLRIRKAPTIGGMVKVWVQEVHHA